MAGCAPGLEAPGPVPAETGEPAVRVLLAEGAAGLEVGGGAALRLLDRDGGVVGAVPAGTPARASAAGGVLVLAVGRTPLRAPFELEVGPAEAGAMVRVAGRDYRGVVRLAATVNGVQAINRLGIESYLAGVVGPELGRRPPEEREALLAQAVVSRTVAWRAVERRRLLGWDLVATVSDQVYAGADGESPEALEAVAATRGVLVTWAGQAIDAFFHSTCGGRTAQPDEVFASAARPYLQSRSDTRDDGTPWCAASPRFRWREEWTGSRLLAILRETLPAQGLGTGSLQGLRDLTITARTPSGRVLAVRIDGGGTAVPVSGPAVRQVLRTADGQPLRSTAFDLRTVREGTALTRVVAEGQGAGHGVGLCQWGAIGRARAGWPHRRILAAYFPGTELERRW